MRLRSHHSGEVGSDECDPEPATVFRPAESLAQFTSGAAAGLVADGVLHPFDTVRTRLWMQGRDPAYPFAYRGVTHAMTSVLREEGFAALFKGFGAVAWFTPAANGLYFATYEWVKKLLENDARGAQYVNISTLIRGSMRKPCSNNKIAL